MKLATASLLHGCLLATVSGLASIPPPTPSSSSSSSDSHAYFGPPSTTGGMAPMSIAKDPMAVLGKQWTSNMDRKVNHHNAPVESSSTTITTSNAIQFYGQDNQANGKGGRGPLGKEWTSAMDMKATKQVQEELHIKPYGLDHQANGQGGRSPLGKVRASELSFFKVLWLSNYRILQLDQTHSTTKRM
jgi:hypothetical protein